MKYTAKRFFSILMTLMLVLNMLPASAISDGSTVVPEGSQSILVGATPGGSNVFVEMEFNLLSADKSGLSKYYVVVGPFEGFSAQNVAEMDTGSNGFVVSQDAYNDYYFIVLKQADNQQAAEDRYNGTTEFYFASNSTNDNTGTKDIANGRYTVSWSKLEDHRYKMIITEKPRARAQITLAAEVPTDDMYVVFRQPMNNSSNKSYCVKKVTGSGEYLCDPVLIGPDWGEWPYDYAAETQVLIVKPNEQGRDLTDSNQCRWMFQSSNFDSNNGLTVYYNGFPYPDSNSSDTVTIERDTTEPIKTNINVGEASYTARLDLYDAWNVKHTETVQFTNGTDVTASNGTDSYSDTITENGAFLTGYTLPSNLTSWTFDNLDLDGYILNPNPTKVGTEYVFEAHKPDTYSVAVRYMKAWGEEEADAKDIHFDTPGTITMTGTDNRTYTGVIHEDGSVTMDPVPAADSWQINTDNRIGAFTFRPSTTAGQENPAIDTTTHTYMLTLRQARTYRVEVQYYDSWGRGRITEDVPVGEGYTIEAVDVDGAVHTATVDADTGAVDFGQEIPEIVTWTIKHNGTAEDPQLIGSFKTDFGPNNPEEQARYDSEINNVAGYYVITANKPNTYSAVLSFYTAEGEEPLENVTLPETYVIKAKATDGTVITGNVAADGTLAWLDEYSVLPQISEFTFFKANGTDPVTRFGDYVLSVESYQDTDLYATYGAYQIIARAPKLYPSKLEYLPQNTTALSDHYYLVASVEGEKVAYAAVPDTTGYLTFIPFGNANGRIRMNLTLAEAGGTPSAQGIELPEDASFTLVKSDSEMNPIDIYNAAEAPALLNDYTLALTPVIEKTSPDAGVTEEDTLVFKAQKMWTGNEIHITTYNYDNLTPIQPDTPFGDNYYLRVRIHDQESSQVIGWNLIPISDWRKSPEEGQADTSVITVSRFTQLGQRPLDLPDNSDAWVTFDPEKHYIEVDSEEYPARVVRITDRNQLDWYKATNPTFVNDDPPTDFKYKPGEQKDGYYQIKLSKAKPVDYFVRLKFDTTDPSQINLDGGLYVKVTVKHQSGQDTYGWEKIDNANFKKSPNMTVDTDAGCTYIDVPISQWKDGQGNIINGEKYKGTEKEVKVELVGAVTMHGNVPRPAQSSPMTIGSYVNKAMVEAYPTGTKDLDHFEEDDDSDPSNPRTRIWDVVSLTMKPDEDKFDGYSLDYILNGYNIVTLCPNTTASPSNSGESAFGDGDFLMKNHCMGGVLIRGDIIHMSGTGVADSEFIEKPSVIGGYVPANAQPFINNRENNNNSWNGYVGSVNTVVGETVNGVTASGSPSKPRPDGSIRGYTGSAGHTAAYGDTYIDWDKLQQDIVNTSEKLAENRREITAVRLDSGEFKVDVTLGDNVVVKYPEGTDTATAILNVNIQAPEGLDPQTSSNIPSTIVSLTGDGTYIPPKVTVNNAQLTTKEDGKGMSLVWNYPNAAQVNLGAAVTPFFGHIVAPKAYINVEGGNYSGCMVGNKVSSAGEGHLYPYNGGKLIKTDIGFQASKTVDEMPPEEDKLFYFDLAELNQDGSLGETPGEWITKETAKNETGSVQFDEIDYTDPGTYYYRISERQSSVFSDIKLDTTEYIVKTVVTSQIDGADNKLVVESQTYYRVPENVTDYVESYTEEGITKYRIREDVLENLNVPAEMSGEQIAAAYLKFNNASKENTGITVRKTLTGETLANGQFKFQIQRTSPLETENGVVDETGLLGTDTPVTNTAEGTASFGKLKFTLKEGKDSESWTYKVWEVQPDPADPNYIYDQSEYELTFTVTRQDNTVDVTRTILRVKNADGTIPDAGVTVQDITFANTRRTGELEIGKTVVSPVPAEKTQKFSFTVELKKMNGQPLAGTFGGYTFDANGRATIEVTGGSTVSITGIPTGATYTVTEAVDESFTTTVGDETTNAASGTITETKSSAAFTNTRKTGSVGISKTVVSPIPAERTKTFTFTIQLSDQTISGSFSGTVSGGTGTEETPAVITFTNGAAEVTVNGGQTLTVTGLPTGVDYTITEATDSDFTTEPENGAAGTITAAGKTEAFTNTRKLGDLEISKTVTGTSDKTKVFHFTVTVKNGEIPVSGTYEAVVTAAGEQLTQFPLDDAGKRWITFGTDGKAEFTLKADEKVLIKGLPQGVTYMAAEDTSEAKMPKGYEQSAPAGGEAAGTISGETARAAMGNTYTLETTSVNFGGMKYIQGTDSTDKVFTFELYETDSTYSTENKTPVETQTSGTIGTAGQTYSFSTITYDTANKDYYYAVKEKAFAENEKEGWSTDDTVYRVHVHTADNLQGQLLTTVKVYNQAGELITGKTAGDLNFTNTYKATGTVSFSAAKVFTNGNLYEHPITIRLTYVEDGQSETQYTDASERHYQQQVVLTANGGADTATFNDVLNFTKTIGNDDTQSEFWFLLEEIDSPLSSSIRYDANPKRWIKVTLTDDGKGHLTAIKNVTPVQSVASETPVDVEFINEQLGSVQVKKVFDLNGATIPDSFQITAKYTVNGQEQIKILKTAAGEGVVGPDSTTCDGSSENPFIWTIDQLPIDTVVTFTESGMTVDGYEITSTFTKTGQTAPSGTTEGSLSAAATQPTGTFVNTYTRETGSLKLKKTVTVNGEGTETDLVDGTYTFTIQGTDTATSTLPARVITIEFEHGSVKSIREGDTIYTAGTDGFATIEGFPTGTYSVTETLPVGAEAKGIRIAEQPAADITIEKDGPNVEIKTAVFRNNRDVGSLEISKTVTGTTDKTKEFAFNVSLAVPAGGVPLAGSYPAVLTTGKGTDAVTEEKTVTVDAGGKIKVQSGSSSEDIVLKADQSLLIKDLPAGTTYTVSEKTPLPAGYQKDSPAGNHTGAISSTPSTAAFVNNYTLETTSVAFGGQKMIEGVDSTQKEFYFELHGTGSDYAAGSETLLQTVHTSGTIQQTAGKTYGFTAITYDNVTDKTNGDDYYYVIREKAFAAGEEGGWTISDLEYRVHVNVRDNGDGSLSRTVELFDKSGSRIQGDNIGALNFTNTYKASGETDLKAKKIFTNGKLSEHPFSFTVTQVRSDAADAQAVTDPAELKLAANPMTAGTTATNPENNEIVTLADQIKFNEADIGKTFYFRVSEDLTGLNLENGIADGIRYDTESRLITITVEDGGNGTLNLVKVPARPDDGTDFDVTYTNEQLGSIQLTKKVLNKSNEPIDTSNKYTFTITGTGVSETVDVDANSTTPVTVSNLPLNTELTIEETNCPGIAGYQYDATTLKVNNGQPATGKTVSVMITNTETKTVTVEAVNTYDQKTGTAEIQATKRYNNWGDGKQFTFTLTAGSNDAGVDTPMPGDATEKSITLPNNATDNHVAAFGEITYSKAGIYNYTMQETGTGSNDGVTYDTNTYAVQVVVTEGDTGLMTAVTYGTENAPATASAGSLTITNTYTAAGHNNFSGTKTFEGREFKSGDAFTFTITPKGGAPLRRTADGEKLASDEVSTTAVTSGHEASIPYGDFYFTFDDIKDIDPDPATGKRTAVFTYDVTEQVPEDTKRIAYDPTLTKVLSITVTDEGTGQLSVLLTENTTVPDYTNTYSNTGATSLKAKKTFTNGKLSEHTFSFTITQVQSDAADAEKVSDSEKKLAENPTGPISTKNTDSDNEIVTLVSEIAFTEADAGKTFYFRIEEDTTGVDGDNIKDGIHYDANSSKLITVTVTDPQDGTPLVITKSPAGESTDYDVSYTNEQLGAIKLKKAVVDAGGNKIDTADGTYVFSITGNGESRTADVPANGNDYVTVKNLPIGTYTITETSSPDVTGYNYKSTAIKAGDATVPGKTATVTITNNDTKTVEVITTNTYQIKSGEAEIRVTKDYNKWEDGKEFTFTLTAGENDAPGDIETPVPEEMTGKATANSRTVVFGPINYTETGTYNYTIQETGTGTNDGVEYDTTVYSVQVTVTTGDSGLQSTVAYGTKEKPNTPEANSLTVINTYDASGYAAFSGTKTLNGREFTSGDSFAFTIIPDSGAPLRLSEDGATQDSTTVHTEAKTGGHEAGITYGPFYYKLSDLDGAASKTFTYTVSEVVPEGDRKGITYAASQTLSITVTDQGDGSLAAVLAENTTAPAFTNTYDAAGKAGFTGTKTLNGREFTGGDSFEFTIKPLDSAPLRRSADGDLLSSDTVYTETVTGGHTAGIDYGFFCYKLADLNGAETKTFRYSVSEVEPADKKGITYAAAQTLEIKVTDNGDGTLAVALPEGTGTGPNFTNSYEAKGTVTFTGLKTFTNGKLKDHPFTLQITQVDAKDSPNQATKNIVLANPVKKVLNADASSANAVLSKITFVRNSEKDDVAEEDGTAKEYWFMIEELDENEDKSGIRNDPVSRYWVKVTLTDNGEGSLIPAKSPDNKPDASFTNEQLGGIRVSKAFTGETVNVENSFTITAVYTQDSQTVTRVLKIHATGEEMAPVGGTGTESDPYIWEIKYIPVGTDVTFTESGITADGYSVGTTFNGSTVTDPAGTGRTTKDIPTCAFVNNYTRDEGVLKLSKTVKVNGSTNIADTSLVDGTYSFTVRGIDDTLTAGISRTITVTISGGQMTAATEGGKNLTISGGCAEITGLPTGLYTVTEDETGLAARFLELLSKPDGTLEVVKDEAGATIPTAAFVNGRNIGDLLISKEVSGTSDNTVPFEFRITLTLKDGAALNGAFPIEASAAVKTANSLTDTITITNGTATVFLKKDESIKIRNLPAGTSYSVEELNIPEGYGKTWPAGAAADAIAQGETREAAFINQYSLGSTSLTFGGTKTIQGTESTSRVFRFYLYRTGSDYDITGITPVEAMTSSPLSSGQSYSFAPITYTKDDKGNDFYYVIREEQLVQAETGWLTDAREYREKVHVSDNGSGQLQTTVTGDMTDPTGLDFTNTYSATGTVAFQAKKIFTNGNLNSHPIRIILSQVDGDGSETAPMSNIVLASPISMTLDADSDVQTAAFNGNGDQITAFAKNTTRDDTQNTYWFMIREEDPASGSDVVMDSTDKRWIKVTLTDDGNGHLLAAKTPGAHTPAADTDGNDAVFTNEQLGSVRVTKTFNLNGATIPDSFQITAKYTVNGQEQTLILKTAAGSGAIGPDNGSTGNPYIWTIDQLPINTVVTFTESGMTVDGYAVVSTFTKTGEAEPSGTTAGSLCAAVTAPEGSFVNTYTRDTGSLRILKTATVNGDESKAAETKLIDGNYAFTVTGPDNTEKHVVITITDGVVAGVSGDGSQVTENGITYAEMTGLPTGDYTVEENLTNDQKAAGIHLTQQPATSIAVKKNNTNNIPSASFTNNLEIGELKVSKSVLRTSNRNKEFTFTITLTKGTTPVSGTFPATIRRNSGTQTTSATFDSDGKWTVMLHADEHVLISKLPGGTDYSVSEADPGDGYSQTQPANGQPDVGTIGRTTSEAAFVNTYNLRGTTLTFGGRKSITVADSTTQKFRFELYETSGTGDDPFALSDGQQPLETAETDGTINKTDGQDFTFSTITYEVPSTRDTTPATPFSETHYYVVKEAVLNENGWTQAETVYKRKVIVMDGGQGTLVKEIFDEKDKEIVPTRNGLTGYDFVNDYAAVGSVSFQVKKSFTNGNLKDHPFLIRLKQVDGDGSTTAPQTHVVLSNPIEKTLNADADEQTVTFNGNGDEIDDFVKNKTQDDTLNTYWFMIEEVDPAGSDDVVMDPVSRRWIKVTLEDDCMGHLQAVKTPGAGTPAADADGNDAVFANEQLGSVQVSKIFTGHSAPDTFAITAKYSVNGASVTKTLKITADNNGALVPKRGDGTEDNPYIWEIENLPINTMVTFSESGMTVDNYTLSTAFNGTVSQTGALAAACDPPTGAFVNTYTRDTGKLQIRKTVTVNGYDKVYSLADGVYYFTVKSDEGVEPAVTKNLTLEIREGKLYAVIGDGTKDGEYAVVDDLPTGNYTVTEDESRLKPGIRLAKKPETTITVSKNTGGVIPTAEFVNDMTINVKIQKTDLMTGEELDGATLQVLDEEENLIDEWVSVKGQPHTVTCLEIGKTYILREKAAPSGYIVTADKHFLIGTDGKTASNDTTIREDGAVLMEDDMLRTCATIRKVWNDDGNRDGLRPVSLKAELLADGSKTGLYVVLSEENNWLCQLKDLPVVKDGKEIVYTWAESAVEGYQLTGTLKTGTLTILTNTHTPDETEISVRKVWEGEGTHPESVKVQLYADGRAVGEEVTLNAGNGWKYTWTGLCRYANPTGARTGSGEIVYKVVETEIPEGYEAKITGSASAGFVITNTKLCGKLVIEKAFKIDKINHDDDDSTTDIEVIKIWDDDGNRDGNRPESVTVHLYAGGEEIKTAVLNEANGWKRHFGELPKFRNGHPIHYSITEDPVKWYVSSIDGFTIRNRYVPESTTVVVRKVWNDAGYEAHRPLRVVMRLSNGMKVVLNEQNGWMASISGLPTHVNGQPAVYTWTEESVMGYQMESIVTDGNVTTVTNKPANPETELGGPGRKTGTPEQYMMIGDYDTALGVDTIINHVGDCFD